METEKSHSAISAAQSSKANKNIKVTLDDFVAYLFGYAKKGGNRPSGRGSRWACNGVNKEHGQRIKRATYGCLYSHKYTQANTAAKRLPKLDLRLVLVIVKQPKCTNAVAYFKVHHTHADIQCADICMCLFVWVTIEMCISNINHCRTVESETSDKDKHPYVVGLIPFSP